MKNTIALILAAGKGTRMKSELPKPIVPLKGKPIVQYVIDSFKKSGIDKIIIIIGYKSAILRKTLGPEYIYIEQTEQKGTAHAIMQAKDKIDWKNKDVFVFVGDGPLITSNTIIELLAYHKLTNSDCTFLTADFKIRLPYARVIKNSEGNLIRCVEEKNASAEELEVTELLSSHFIFKGNLLFTYINEIKPDPENGEYYLTDILDILLKNGHSVEALHIDNFEELVGLNTPEDLAWAEQIINKRGHGKN